MKTKMSKILAIAASAVLLVCMLAVGFTASADVTYEKSINFNAATPSEGVTLSMNVGGNGVDGYAFASTENATTAGSAVLSVGEVFTDWKIEAIDSLSAGVAGFMIEFSADNSTWTEITDSDYARVEGDFFSSGWQAKYATYTGTADASAGYKYVRVSADANPWGVPVPAFKTFDYNTVKITYTENVKVKTAFTAEWGSHGEVDGSYGLLPEGGSATFEAEGAITDYKFYLANGGGDSAFTVEFSKDGATWDAATGAASVVDTHNSNWGSSWVTYTGTNDAAAAYKYVRVTSTKLNVWVPAIPFYDTFEYNYEEIATPPVAVEPVGEATDPETEYDKTVDITDANYTIPEGTKLSYGIAGKYIDPYYGLVVDDGTDDTMTTGAITVDLGEAFKAILFDVADNQDGYTWKNVEVSADGTEWFPLNYKTVTSETTVGAGAFNMRATTYSATVDADAGYRYVRLSYGELSGWGFITPAIAAIKYDCAVEPVGTPGAAKDSYTNEKDFSTATTSPAGTSLTGDIPGVAGTSAGDGYLALTTPDAGLCVPGSIVLNIGEVFTDISVLGMQNNASDGFMGFFVSTDGENWVPLNIQKNDTGNKHGIAGWDISYFTFDTTVDADAGYQWLRIDVVGCPWAMPSPAVKAVKYNVPATEPDPDPEPTPDPEPDPDPSWAPDLSENATVVDKDFASSTGMADAPVSYGFYTGGNMNQNGGTYDNGQHSEWLGAGKIIVLFNQADEARFAFDVNAPKDFNFLVSIGTRVTDPSTVIKVYAADSFEGGSYGGEAGGHAVEPATPVNAEEITVTFERDATQGGADLTRWNVKCAEDIPATATYLYLVMDKDAKDTDGHWYAVGLLDFNYTSDPITIEPLPGFGVADDQELFEDLSSSRLLMDDDGQALSITNLMRAAANKFGKFNEADDMLVLNDKTAGGEIVYDLSAYHDYMNDTEGYKALVTGIDVRGWIATDLLNSFDKFDVLASADGETWVSLAEDATDVRLSEVYNGYSQFSILIEEIAEEYSFVKFAIGATEDEFALSDIQILYTENENAGDEDEGGNDDEGGNNDEGGNDDESSSPDTGVVAPIAALVLATISGAAVVINKRR